MANQTYAALKKQQAELEKLIERTKQKEQRGVIKRMVEAIEFYELTATDLGFKDLTHPLDFKGAAAKPAKVPPTKKAKPHPLSGIPKPIRYRHGEDKWTGMGHTPPWMKALIEQGRDKEEFRVFDEPTPAKVATPKRNGVPHAPDSTPVPGMIYRSVTGKEWDGVGKIPAWIQVQIYGKKATKKLADFAVQS